MLKGKRISSILPKSGKKSIANGGIMSVKMRGCDECKGEILCITCNNQVNENKEFEASLNLLRRQPPPPNEFVHMLPYYKEKVNGNCENNKSFKQNNLKCNSMLYYLNTKFKNKSL